MDKTNKEVAIKKIAEMSEERVAKLLIFMAGMEAGEAVEKKRCDKAS
jgi:hypothetical protein